MYAVLCDGCHAPLNECYCDEIEAEREEMYGPRCFACGGDEEDGWPNCEFGNSGVYVPGPGDEESHGCPRVTGTF